MKKLFYLFLFVLSLVFTAACVVEAPTCTDHVDANRDGACDVCGATVEVPPCTNHIDENNDKLCDVCGATIEDHEPPVDTSVKVSSIFVVSDDEEAEGTADSPYHLTVAQGQSVQVSYSVSPNNATDKTFDLDVTPAGKVTATCANGKFTFTAASDATDAVVVKATAHDGSGVEVYFAVAVEGFVNVTGISSNALLASDDAAYDYVLHTAVGTKWDMSGDMLARGQKLLDGQVFGGMQAPRNITYWPILRNIGIVVAPSDATDAAVEISYSNEGIIEIQQDGTYDAKACGETVVTVASHADPSKKFTIRVVVEDSLYPGILKSEFEATTTSDKTSWDLDANHGTDAQFSRYDDWHLVMVQAQGHRGDDNDDGNQKIFYMGEANRPYGIALENNVKNSGDLSTAASLTWAKVQIPFGCETFNVKIGNNDKTHGQYRVSFVSEAGVQTVLSNGWEGFASNNSEALKQFAVPEALQGQVGAIVIEHRLTQNNNNAELHLKVMKFEGNVAVSGITLPETAGTYKGGQTFNLGAKVTPDNASNQQIVYSVKEEDQGKGVTVSGAGDVVIAEGTAAGQYTIYAVSVGDATKTATYVLTVTEDEIVVNKWGNKAQILNGVQGIAWTVNGSWDQGVGEGVDLKTATGGWSYISLSRAIKADAAILTFDARVFVRGGETDPKFEVRVVDGETTTTIRAIGATKDYVKLLTTDKRYDTYNYFSYDLSAFAGKTVEIQIGVTQGTHGAINYIEFHDGTLFAEKPNSISLVCDGESSVTMFSPEKDKNYQISSSLSNLKVLKPYTTDLTLDGGNEFVSLSGNVLTVKAGAPAGTYTVSFKLVADETITGSFTVVIEEKPAVVEQAKEYKNKAAIVDNWELVGNYDAGVGEGADLQPQSSNGWAAWKMEREITATSYALKVGARTFVRDAGETNPRFVIKVTLANGRSYIVKANGYNTEYVEFSCNSKVEGSSVYDSTFYMYYDLSAFIGQKVTVEVGATQGNHAVVQYIGFSGTAYEAKQVLGQQGSNNKNAILDFWGVDGTFEHQGVGEGADVGNNTSTNSAVLNKVITIGQYQNATLTLQARIFGGQGGGVDPVVKVWVWDGAKDTILEPVFGNKVITEESPQTLKYDLSQFAGKEVKVMISTENQCYHCVFTYVELSGLAYDGGQFGTLNQQGGANKEAILAAFSVNGQWNSGVGEGVDLTTRDANNPSYLSKQITVSEYCRLVKVQGRIFNGQMVWDGVETFPQVKLVVVVDGVEHVINEKSAGETAVINGESPANYTFRYDLSEFAGQTVELRIVMANVTHHCVLTFVELY